jgi:hypothetical protein
MIGGVRGETGRLSGVGRRIHTREGLEARRAEIMATMEAGPERKAALKKVRTALRNLTYRSVGPGDE